MRRPMRMSCGRLRESMRRSWSTGLCVDLCGCGPLHLYADPSLRRCTGCVRSTGPTRHIRLRCTRSSMRMSCGRPDRYAITDPGGIIRPRRCTRSINADPRGRLVSTRRRTRHRTNHGGSPSTFDDGVARSTWPRRSLVTAFPTDSFAQIDHVFSAVPRRGATLLEFD